MNTIKKIAIIGPESTGKSSLASVLAERFNTIFVPEMSRVYLEETRQKWTYEDVLKIAQLQLKKEDELLPAANQFLFCDTEMICIKVWLEFYNLEVPSWIINEIRNRDYAHFFLMNIDLKWEADSLRENPNDRQHLFEMFKQNLTFFNKQYTLIEGSGEDRIAQAATVLNQFKTI